MNETERRFLRRLRDADFEGLAKSQIPLGCDNLVQALQTCGAAQFKPAPAGRGVLFVISSAEAFRRFVAGRLPGGLNVEPAQVTSRGAAVTLLADAKAARQSVGQGLVVRAASPDVTIRNHDGEAICISTITHQTGAACFKLSSGERWRFSGRIAVIENADAFWQYELVLFKVDLALLAGDRMSRRLLSWLGSAEMSDCLVTHWGDYDPVGICEYVRLHEACPGRVDSHAPAAIDELLPRYGKRSLITDQLPFIARLRRNTHLPHVSRMLRLFDSHRRGLEQEVLLHLATSGSLNA